MKKLKIYNRIETIVDDEIYELLKNTRLHLDGTYPAFQENGKRQWIHKIVCPPKKGFWTDHINGNRLDNRKENLRLVTPQQNVWNSKVSPRNKIGYKGVAFRKNRNKFTSVIFKDGKRYGLGHHSTAESAALAYNQKALELFGEFARLNEIK